MSEDPAAKKDWALSDPRVSKGAQTWQVDVIRCEDDERVMTLTLNPETLPPRWKDEKGKKKGKKTKVWELPESGTKLTLGFHETERVIALFREKRKQAKKERASQQKRLEDLFPAARKLGRSTRKWILRHCFRDFVRRCREPIRYSKEDLLRLQSPRPSLSSSMAAPGHGSRVGEIPSGIRRVIGAGVVGQAPFGSLRGFPSNGPRAAGLLPTTTMNHLGPSVTQACFGSGNNANPYANANANAPATTTASTFQPTMSQMLPPGLGPSPMPPPLGYSVAPGIAPPPAMLDVTDLEGSASPTLTAKEVWKRDWKDKFLKQLEILAEKAWQQEHEGGGGVVG